MWGALAAAALAFAVTGGLASPVRPPMLVLTVGPFVAVTVARIVLCARRERAQRAALVTLAVAVSLWIIGVALIGSEVTPGHRTQASAAEWAFLAAYIGFAAFLLQESHGGLRATLAVWLEAAVAAGGVSILVGVLLAVSPMTAADAVEMPVFVALLYPLFDLALALIVVGQLALRHRSLTPRSLILLSAFLVLGAADVAFASSLASGDYDSPALLDLAWMLAFALLAQAAAMPRAAAAAAPTRITGGALLLAASGVALLVLIVPLPGSRPWYLTASAAFTLIAAGGRLAIALRQARSATESYRLAQTDDLTGLPNRRAVVEEIDARAARGPVSLLILDFDVFKDVNDTFGHPTGDEVLALVAIRLLDSVPRTGLVGRLGGAVFAVVDSHGSAGGLLGTAAHLQSVLSEPFRVEGLEIVLRATVGIAVREEDESAVGLLRRADIALDQAHSDHVGALLYDPDRDQFSRHRLHDVELLRHAVADGRIVVCYQPQVDAITRAVVGVEALVRWSHPDGVVRPPDAFLPLARHTGLMPAISQEVLRQVVEAASRWMSQGRHLHVAMNLSPLELLGGLVVTELVAEAGRRELPRGTMVLEVTEDAFLADPVQAMELLRDLDRVGVEISVDDYGTGFSSLSYLRDLRTQELKIDRSFVARLVEDERGEMIVRSTTQMAHALGMRVVAEGVEDEEVAIAVTQLGVDVLQGFHISRPLPPTAIDDWLRRN